MAGELSSGDTDSDKEERIGRGDETQSPKTGRDMAQVYISVVSTFIIECFHNQSSEGFRRRHKNENTCWILKQHLKLLLNCPTGEI